MFVISRVRRRKVLVIAAAAALISAGAAWAIWHPPAQDTSPPVCGKVVLAPQEPAKARRAPDGRGLRVVEQGFTQLGTHRDQVAVGAILENTSSFVAYRTQVSLEFLDATPTLLPFKEFLGSEYYLDIPIILPGERIGYGRVLGLGDGNPGKVNVATLRLNLGTTQWRTADPARFALVTGTFEHHIPRTAQNRDPETLTYRETSSHCGRLESHGTVSIYRDAGGAIVGGHLDVPLPNGNVGCRPGTESQRIFSWFHHYPVPVDVTKTGIYPYCDVVPWISL